VAQIIIVKTPDKSSSRSSEVRVYVVGSFSFASCSSNSYDNKNVESMLRNDYEIRKMWLRRITKSCLLVLSSTIPSIARSSVSTSRSSDEQKQQSQYWQIINRTFMPERSTVNYDGANLLRIFGNCTYIWNFTFYSCDIFLTFW